MDNFLRERIRDRLETMGITAFEAARRAGSDRTFIHDLLIGKKDSIRPASLERIAAALECDPEYLIGAQATTRKPPHGTELGGMVLAGICEAGAWRGQEAAQMPMSLPVAPDPRFPSESQAAYLVRGHHADDLGLQDGDLLICINDEAARDGDLVICRRTRARGEVELTARLLEGGEVRARPGVSLSQKQTVDAVKVLGRVIFSHRTFSR